MAFKVEVEAKEFVAAVKLLDQVPARTGYLCSYSVKMVFEKDRILMYLSSEISAEIVVKTSGEASEELLIDRRLLFPFLLANVSDAVFQISYDDAQLLIKQGRRKANFTPATGISGYGQSPSLVKAQKVDLSALAEAIKCSATCAVNDPIWPQYSCVYIHKDDSGKQVILATNQIVGFGEMFKNSAINKFPFPLNLVGLLVRDDLVTVYILPSMVVLVFDKGKIWQSFSAKADKFPFKKMMDYFAITADTIFAVEAKEFSKALDRLSTYLSGIEKKDWVIAFNGKQGLDKVQAKAEVAGAEFAEILATKTTAKTDFKVAWPLAYVFDALVFMSKAGKDIKVMPMADAGYLITNGKTYLAVAKK